jgi:hypothetical protein
MTTQQTGTTLIIGYPDISKLVVPNGCTWKIRVTSKPYNVAMIYLRYPDRIEQWALGPKKDGTIQPVICIATKYSQPKEERWY